MASISSIGISSGVLTSELIENLVKAEKAPTELRLDRQKESLEAELSAYGRLQSALTDLRLPSRVLSLSSAVKQIEGKSTQSAIGVEANTSAKPGQYTMEVSQLAQAHSIKAANAYASEDTVIGTGTLTLNVGDKTTNITIDNTNNTLKGVVDAINAESKTGVNAQVIKVDDGFQLVISSSTTGKENAVRISVAGDADGDPTTGLSQLAYDGTDTANIVQAVEAKDAEFSINGVAVSRATNTVDDVISGVEFSLTGITSSPATISISPSEEKVAESINEMITAYNSFKEIVSELTAFKGVGESGILLGDNTLRNIDSQVRKILSSTVSGLEGSRVSSLSEIGVSTNKDTGQLEFNKTAFKKVFADNVNDITALFSSQGRTSDNQIEFAGSSYKTAAGKYDVEVTKIATQGSLTATDSLANPASTIITDDNNNFTLAINGITSGDITLDKKGGAAYTGQELAEEIQKQINADNTFKSKGISASVSFDNVTNKLVISSNTYGSKSTVEIKTVDTQSQSTLGLSVATGTAGENVEGKINGVEAKGDGQRLTAEASAKGAEGISLLINGGAIGNRGTVNFISGIGQQLVSSISSFLGAEGTLTARQDGLRDGLSRLEEERSDMNDRLASLEARLSKQFTAADILVGRLKSTEEFITAQLKALSGTSDK